MSHVLDRSAVIAELLERLTFALHQNHELAKDTIDWLDEAVVVRLDTSQEPWHVVSVKWTQPVPIGLRMRAGQIINDVRSCLDNLASSLAVLNGKSTVGVFFPIAKDAISHADEGPRALKKLASSDRNRLMALDCHGDANPCLRAFHDMDRRRKHVSLGVQNPSNNGIGTRNGAVKIAMGVPSGPLVIGEEKAVWCAIPDGPLQLTISRALFFDGVPELEAMSSTQAIEWFIGEAGRIVNAMA